MTTEYNNNNNNSSQNTTAARIASKYTSRPYHHEYTSSIDETEESDSYISRRTRRLSDSNHRKTPSSSLVSRISNRKIEAREDAENNNKFASRRRYTRKWETDDELFKPNHRPIIPQQQQHSPINNCPDEAATTRSLLYLLNKERTKRREVQDNYDKTAQALKELQQNHQSQQDDVNALESDIQTLQDALMKESKRNTQLNKLLHESKEEMQMLINKFALVEEQGRELQKTFKETMEQLEKEEEEVTRLRKENQSLKDQLTGKSIESTNLNRIEDVRKVGSMEDTDDLSAAESKLDFISDNESVANYSKLTELNDRITELENELITSKENTQKVESSFQELESEKSCAIKQLEENHKKKVSLLRATISQKQKTIEDLEKELRKAKFNEREREEKFSKTISHRPSQQFSSPQSPKLLQHHQPLLQQQDDDDDDDQPDRPVHHRPNLIKRKSIPSEIYIGKERKNSLTSTNSGSVEGTSVTGGSLGDKDDARSTITREGESEIFSDDDQSSSIYTGSRNGSEETASVQEPTEPFIRIDSVSKEQKDSDEVVEDEIDLDAILSDREDRCLPLIGHYSAAEYTEDEDFENFDCNRSRSFKIGGNRIEGNSMVMALNQITSGGRRNSRVKDDDGIP